MRDAEGQVVETVEGLFHRVAHHIAQADKAYDPQADIGKTEQTFFDMMTRLEFLPNSPTLMNAGKQLGQLSACFVLPVGDSMEEIAKQLDPRRFFRANRQYIIQRNAVKDISAWFGSKLSVNLTVPAPEKVIVSRTNTRAFKDWITENE